MSDESGAAGEQGGLVSRLRAVIGAKDEQIAALQSSLEAALAALEGEREIRRRLELRLAEVERRLSMDSTDSGTPSSKERTGAKEARRARQESERQRRKDRKRGAQHQAVSGYWHESGHRDSCHYAEAEVMPRLAWQPWPGHWAQGSDQHISADSLV